MIQEEVLSTAINHSTLSILSFDIYMLDAKKTASARGRKHLAEISPLPPTVNVVVILTMLDFPAKDVRTYRTSTV